MKLLLIALALLAPLAAAAADEFPRSCTFNVDGRDGTLDLDAGSSKGRLHLGDEELNALGPCHLQDVPGRRAFRCTFANDTYRLEVYPLAMQGGAFPPLNVIVWKNGKTVNVQGDCK